MDKGFLLWVWDRKEDLKSNKFEFLQSFPGAPHEFWKCLLEVWVIGPWASYSVLLCLSFLICKIGKIRVHLDKVAMMIEWIKYINHIIQYLVYSQHYININFKKHRRTFNSAYAYWIFNIHTLIFLQNSLLVNVQFYLKRILKEKMISTLNLRVKLKHVPCYFFPMCWFLLAFRTFWIHTQKIL